IWNSHDTLVALAPPVADRRRMHAIRPAALASSFFLIRSTGSARADAADVPPATERIALRHRPCRAVRTHRRAQPSGEHSRPPAPDAVWLSASPAPANHLAGRLPAALKHGEQEHERSVPLVAHHRAGRGPV